MGFEAGAMTKLRRLVLGVHDRWGGGSAMPVGMVHLLSLEQIHVDNMSSVHDDRDVESAFRNAAQCVHVTTQKSAGALGWRCRLIMCEFIMDMPNPPQKH